MKDDRAAWGLAGLTVPERAKRITGPRRGKVFADLDAEVLNEKC